MVVESYGVEKYFDENMDLTNYLLRVMKIKVPETTDTEAGLLPHTDMNMLNSLDSSTQRLIGKVRQPNLPSRPFVVSKFGMKDVEDIPNLCFIV
ncbi:hypothetical protein RHGRI_031098 [Rhododendron griersonianum]|uniref:Uncharacterized protein n=1 Tax=Rhododendron griersonianum TaxID=479676 RepID=A0AAV6I6X0_9ERIC|nr:hypothetical protein RHGRI_031098 [Rhododendron griersonianum]